MIIDRTVSSLKRFSSNDIRTKIKVWNIFNLHKSEWKWRTGCTKWGSTEFCSPIEDHLLKLAGVLIRMRCIWFSFKKKKLKRFELIWNCYQTQLSLFFYFHYLQCLSNLIMINYNSSVSRNVLSRTQSSLLLPIVNNYANKGRAMPACICFNIQVDLSA